VLLPDLAILPEVAQSDLFTLAETSNAEAEWIGSNPANGLGVAAVGPFGPVNGVAAQICHPAIKGRTRPSQPEPVTGDTGHSGSVPRPERL